MESCLKNILKTGEDVMWSQVCGDVPLEATAPSYDDSEDIMN